MSSGVSYTYDATPWEALLRRVLDGDEDSDARLSKRRFHEFDCPICQANNPTEPFGAGEEVLCHYCATNFLVKVSSEGELSLREI